MVWLIALGLASSWSMKQQWEMRAHLDGEALEVYSFQWQNEERYKDTTVWTAENATLFIDTKSNSLEIQIPEPKGYKSCYISLSQTTVVLRGIYKYQNQQGECAVFQPKTRN